MELFGQFILADGLVHASVFFYNVLSQRPVQEVVKNCTRCYLLDSIERYFLYIVLSFVNVLFPNTLLLLLLGVFPHVQNQILTFSTFRNVVLRVREDRIMFVKYVAAKAIFRYIQSLHPNIQHAKNYHIFIIYRVLVHNVIVNCAKATILISFLWILKSSQNTSSTYFYYYKIIKYAYYYQSGFLFTNIERTDAIDVINNMICSKRWQNVANPEVVNAIVALSRNRLLSVLEHQYYGLKTFAIWSVIGMHRIPNFPFVLYAALLFALFHKQRMHVAFVIVLIVLNVNDILVTFLFLNHKSVHWLLAEFVFFVKNRTDIKTVSKKIF
jgi:hypothetical protein